MMKSRIKWWPWFLALAVTVGCGFYRRWDTFSLVVVGIVMFTGLLRLFFMWSLPRVARSIARMPPEEREKYLSGMKPEERQKFEERLKEYENP